MPWPNAVGPLETNAGPQVGAAKPMDGDGAPEADDVRHVQATNR
jgi:hypothetical protein